MLPTPHVIANRVRVFFASCDADLRGRIFSADFDREPPFRLLEVAEAPVLGVGPPGAFDCDGVNPSQILTVDGRLALLYIGWRRGGERAPYTLFGGVAFSDDDGRSFQKEARLLLPPCAGESLFRTAPFLHRDSDGWRLLYIGGDAFVADPAGRSWPIYSLMELRSPSPWTWDWPGCVLLAPDRSAGEIGFGRPVLWDDDGQASLMLSVRTRAGYSLVQGPAHLSGGVAAFRPVLNPPWDDWEAGMTCFGAPCVVGEHELLFYNGDGFGRSGLGLAWRPRG